MDNNTKDVLSDLVIVFVILCFIAGCVTCNYFDNNCHNNCKSKTEQTK